MTAVVAEPVPLRAWAQSMGARRCPRVPPGDSRVLTNAIWMLPRLIRVSEFSVLSDKCRWSFLGSVDVVEPGAVMDERATSNAYLMSLAVEPDGRDVIDEAVAQVASWLRHRPKAWDPRLDGNGFKRDRENSRDLLTLHHESKTGREFRFRLTEETRAQGVWRTQLTVSVPRAGDPWLALHVGNSQGRWAAVPRLATNLLDTLRTRDGLSSVSSEPLIVGPGNTEDFLERLTDPDRRGLFFAAGSDNSGIDFRAFAAQVGRWVAQVRGLGQMAVLTPEATEYVAKALGPSHAIAPWTIRTFHGDVDPAVRSDGFRHKWLTTDRLVRERDDVIRQLLGRIARRHAALTPQIEGYAAADRVLRRLEDKTLVESITSVLVGPPAQPAPTPVDGPSIEEPIVVPDTVEDLLDQAGPTTVSEPPVAVPERTPEISKPEDPASQTHTADPAALDRAAALEEELAQARAVVDMIKTSLGLDDLTPESLSALAGRAAQLEAVQANVSVFQSQLQERDARESELEARVTALQEAFDDTQLDARVAGDTASQLRDENAFLKRRLADLQDFDAAYGAIPAEAYTVYPDSFADLLERRGEFERAGVVFTGDENEMLAMDEHDTLGNAVRAAWDGYLALADYLRARSEGLCTTGVREYLRETPNGYRSMPTNKFGGKETKATMERWGGLREFPVPVEVEESGTAVMEAHFKLAAIGMVSPRMYFLDCYSTTGKVYVGYIGAHLTNTMS